MRDEHRLKMPSFYGVSIRNENPQQSWLALHASETFSRDVENLNIRFDVL